MIRRLLVPVLLCLSLMTSAVAGASPASDDRAGSPPRLPGAAHLKLASATDLLRRLPPPQGADAAAMRGVLGNSARWLATTWWTTYRNELPHVIADADLMTPVRCERFGMASYALAVALATGAYDPVATGVSVEEATSRARQIVIALARTHRSISPRGWGATWQSALWAALGAQAGWLLGPALSEADRLLVARMLESEADAVRARPMHLLRNRAGKLLTKGDTGAEELAWDGMVLQVAVALLPDHPRRTDWAYSQVERMVNAFARPQDVNNARVVNGKRVGDWLRGSNVEANGLVVNHGRVFPDYSTTINENLFAVTVYPLVEMAVPSAAYFNVDVVYGALSTVSFSGSAYARPGGTPYVRGSGRIYYPEGTDWGYYRQMCFAALDMQVAALGLGGKSPVPPQHWGRLHLAVVRRMQARFSDGHTFAPREDRFWLQEEWVGMQSGWAYLTQWVAANDLVRWTNASYQTVRPGT